LFILELLLSDVKNNDMPENSIKEICLSYLSKYEEKDLQAIEKMFSDDIVLRDWKIRVTGKKNALLETRKNFESVDSIEIQVLSTYENKNTVAAELKITIDATEELYVVDVITINSESKIASIRAYLGRGDV
jgi:ketosteroid isomerase-like protein